MAVCAFLSHISNYDACLNPEEAIKHVVETNDFVDFWISSTLDGMHMFYFLFAASHEKDKHPDKVRITYVTPFKYRGGIPAMIIDRVVTPNIDVAPNHKDLMTWVLQQSTHVISCVYEELYDTEMEIPESAYSHLSEAIDISEQDTREALLENISQMDGRNKKIYSFIKEGRTKEEIGEIMGISPKRAGGLCQKARRELHEKLKRRYEKIFADASHSKLFLP